MENKYKNWDKKFFTGLWNEVQLKMFSAEQTKEQVKFIIDIMKLHKGDKILDVPCGSGRISNVLSKKGFEVVGIDNNKYMLNLAKKGGVTSTIKPSYILKNMWEIDFENEFDSVLCYWGSFGYFDDKTNYKFLERVYRSLKRRGKFLLNTHIVESLVKKFQKEGWFKVKDIFVLEKREYDYINSRINSNWTLIKKGREENKSTSIRLYSYRELIEILKEFGFKKFTPHTYLDKVDFKVHPDYLYLVAEK